jgi:hypothetical protein
MTLSIYGCLPSGHYRSTFPTRNQCQWCEAHPEDRRLKRKPPRRPLGEVVNGVGPGAPRAPGKTDSGCGLCGIHLCRDGPCFDKWHRQNRQCWLFRSEIVIFVPKMDTPVNDRQLRCTTR